MPVDDCDIDCAELSKYEDRLRQVELAVVEIGVISKYLKYLIAVFAASLGIEVGGLI